MRDLILAFASGAAASRALAALDLADSLTGVEVDRLPIQVVRKAAVLDRDGAVVTPAEIDPRTFVGVRLSGKRARDETRDGTLDATFAAGSAKDDYVRSRLVSVAGDDAELIDPASWPGGTPPRVWQ